MRITKIAVTGLFGMFDHEIPLNQDSRITIVNGPNGVGKSVIMHLVHSLFHNETELFKLTPFHRLQVDIAGGTSLRVDSDRDQFPYTLSISLVNGVEAESEDFHLRMTDEEGYHSGINSFDEFHDIEWFTNIRENTRVSILDTFRLLREEYSSDNSRKPKHSAWDASPFGEGVVASLSDLNENFYDIYWKFIDFVEFVYTWGESESSIPEMGGDVGLWLSANTERIDRLRKLLLDGHPSSSQYLTLLGMQDFFEIVNERVLFKQMTYQQTQDACEIIFVSDSGKEVPIWALSSGEQQLLVLYYKLLFETEPNTLVMIDEPEISMNVVWQRNFLKDLQRIVELRQFDVLIATHSPQIIHDKWDWAVHLGAKVDD